MSPKPCQSSAPRPAPLDTTPQHTPAARPRRGDEPPAKDGDHASTPSEAHRQHVPGGKEREEMLTGEHRGDAPDSWTPA
jgi:hypothetical protein